MIFEGERINTSDNNLLGTFVLQGIPPEPRNAVKLTEYFDIDADGILTVVAEDMKSGSKNVITVKNNKGKLSSDEIKRMVQDSEKYKEDDEKHRKKVDLRNTFETYAIKMRSMISNNGGMLSSKDKKNIKNAVNNAVQWLESSELGKTDDIIDKMKALQNLCDPIVDKLYQQGDTDSPPSTRSGSVASKFSKILRSFGFL